MVPAKAGIKAAEALHDDLKRRGFSSNYRAVVISGDFSWENQSEEFEASRQFIKRLSALLELTVSNFVLIPGNHDVTWSHTDPSVAKEFHYLLRDQAEKQYREFFAATRGTAATEYLALVKIFEEEKVVIVGLNSCRLHEKLNAGLGYVGRDQIEEAILRLRENTVYKQYEDRFFKIAVLHHHLLPAVDLDLKELENPPAKRRFSLTLDASGILELLLADNFALVLHGHLHVPFCAVERRLAVTTDTLYASDDAHIAVVAAGSLCVDRLHAARNHYEVFDLGESSIRIYGFQIDGGTSAVTLEKVLLTRPTTRLTLRTPLDHQFDVQSQKAEESAILAERVFEKDSFAIDFLFESLLPACQRNECLSRLKKRGLTELFDSVINAWCSLEDPLQFFENEKDRDAITFTEYIFELMIAACASQS